MGCLVGAANIKKMLLGMASCFGSFPQVRAHGFLNKIMYVISVRCTIPVVICASISAMLELVVVIWPVASLRCLYFKVKKKKDL